MSNYQIRRSVTNDGPEFNDKFLLVLIQFLAGMEEQILVKFLKKQFYHLPLAVTMNLLLLLHLNIRCNQTRSFFHIENFNCFSLFQ